MASEKGNAWERGLADLGAALRQGLKEAGQMLPAFPDSIQPVNEPGTLGNPVAREVYEARHPEPTYEQVLEQQAAQAAKSEPAKGRDMDR